MDKTQLLSKLMESIPFSESELILNKKGIISEAQQKKIKRKVLIEFALFATLIIWSFIVYAVMLGEYFDIVAIIAVVLFLSLIVWLFVNFHRMNNHEGIKNIEGEPEYEIGYGGKRSDIPMFIVKIGKLKFKVEEAVYDAFSGKQVRVYYFQIPKKIVLSVEIL